MINTSQSTSIGLHVPAASEPINKEGKAKRESFSRGWLLKQIYLAYANLPLPTPKNPRKIVLLNRAHGGVGDYAAGYKVVNLMEQIDPHAIISWVSTPSEVRHFKTPSPKLKFANIDHSESGFEHNAEVDLVIQGPLNDSNSSTYLQDKYKIKFEGQHYSFVEICGFLDEGINLFGSLYDRFAEIVPSHEIVIRSGGTIGFLENGVSNSFNSEHQRQMMDAILDECLKSHVLGMGIDGSSGLLFEENSTPPQLSQIYAHPEAMLEIENKLLLEQIFQTPPSTTVPIHSFTALQSLNFGYAHYTDVKGRFIDSVAIHENKKNLTFVFYQIQKGNDLSKLAYFQRKVFTPQRVALLQRLGYGKIVVKSDEKLNDLIIKLPSDNKNSRTLTVILHQCFSKNDMRCLQLASERILATGDNSACEAFSSRFKLYMYEDISKQRDPEEYIGNSFRKGEFLNQQIRVGTEVYPPLGRFLKLSSQEVQLTEGQMKEMETILSDPGIAPAFLKFAETITRNYQFKPLLEGMIRRHFWKRHYPKFFDLEKSLLAQHAQLTKSIAEKYFIKKNDNPTELPTDISLLLSEAAVKYSSGIRLKDYFPKAIAELIHSLAYL